MNIFIFCHSAAMGKGGMEKVAVELSCYLSKKFSVFLCYRATSTNKNPSYEISNKVNTVPWDVSKETAGQYCEKVRKLKPSVFVIFGASYGLAREVEIAVRCNEDAPIIVSESSNPERVITTNWAEAKGISRYQACWERESLYSRVDIIHLLIPDYKNSLPHWLNSKSVSFPNAFHISPKRAQLKEKRIINIGGLKRNKNLIPLIKAFGVIANDFPDWTVHVFSTPRRGKENESYFNSVVNTVRSLNLEKRFFLHEETDNIYSEYLNSSIHVITSLSEGLSNAVAEAMCCGLPSIGIKGVPGVDGIISNDHNGVLVCKENLIDNLSETLSELMRNNKKRAALGKMAYLDAQMFSQNTVYEQWEKMIYSAFEKRDMENIEAEYHYKRF